MTRDACRTRLAEAYAAADFVVVEGAFESDASGLVDRDFCCPGDVGGSLDVLCRRLDLPRLVVLDASTVEDCRFPSRPEVVDGVLLDGVDAIDVYARLQTSLEGAWGVPVVGGLLRSPELARQIAKASPTSPVPREVCERLIADFAKLVDERAIDVLAARTTIPAVAGEAKSEPCTTSNRCPPTVAVAFDDAFCGYFPESLESLERGGAKVVDFSPLSHESLPEQTDVVLVGCGRPDRYAAELSANHCLKAALRDFARRGGRIYAEGGGLAYLGRWLTGADGRDYPMLDLFPFAARRARSAAAPLAVEFRTNDDSWLIPADTACRAYRDFAWTFDALCSVDHLTLAADDLWRIGDLIGGRLQLHLAAQPRLLERLFLPHRPAAFARPLDSGRVL